MMVDPSTPMGATVRPSGVEFRVWASRARMVQVEVDGATIEMSPEDGGVWATTVAGAAAGARYGFRIDGRGPIPDPYSRSQPDGPHGSSQVVDPAAHEWTDRAWRGLDPQQLVIYELHVGAYTSEGTFDALVPHLEALYELGVTAIELMPVAESPGRRNWGYDGVNLFAPAHYYGGASGLRRLVDAAHARRLGVMLDVAYNHLGPDGNYLGQFSPEYFTEQHSTPWGAAINYDGPGSEMVRRFAVDNACYWLEEYHIDGLRLDATFAIFDESPRHILEEIATTARARVTPRPVILIAETHENDARYPRPAAAGGFGFDAVWADDFHHAVHTIATGEHHGYYEAYAGTMEELARTINGGWLFDGSHIAASGHTRGTSSNGLPASAFVYCLQNHDQVGNRALGERLSQLISLDEYRAWSALLLLLPYTPLIFMGQELAASSPFLFFTDHNEELGRLVTEGRRRELAAFPGFSGSRTRGFPDPQSPETFRKARLRLGERNQHPHSAVYALYQELLALRRSDPVLSRRDRGTMHARALSDALLAVQFVQGDDERVLFVNAAEDDAVLQDTSHGAAAGATGFAILLSTDDTQFGGAGGGVAFDGILLTMPARSAALFARTR